jgi:hypothetical protein
MIRRRAVKCFLASSLRSPDMHEVKIAHYVDTVHRLTQNAFLLAKYILIQEVDEDSAGLLCRPLEKQFFTECFLAVNNPLMRPSTSRGCDRTRLYREIISRHFESYLNYYPEARNIQPMTYAQQTALYQGNAMLTAYLNNIQEHMVEHIKHTVNVALYYHANLKAIQMSGLSASDKKSLTYEYRKKCQRVKLSILRGEPLAEVDWMSNSAVLLVAKIISITHDWRREGEAQTLEDSIIRYPETKLKMTMLLSRFLEECSSRPFRACPIRTTLIPSYTQIDTTILCQQILDLRRTAMNQMDVFSVKEAVWNKVFRLNRRPFTKQAGLKFEGTIYSDGVGLTVILQSEPTRAGKKRKRKELNTQDVEEFTNIASMEGGHLKRIQERVVYIDPNKRDLLYCMADQSSADNKHIFRYTQPTKKKRSGSPCKDPKACCTVAAARSGEAS